MAALLNAARAVVDLRKLEDYALDPSSDRGKAKARVFRAALGLTRNDAEWLRARILDAVPDADAVHKGTTPYGVLYEVDLPVRTDTGSATVRTGWIVLTDEAFPPIDHLLRRHVTAPFKLLDTVALLGDVPAHGLKRGEVGTLVEGLADGVWLVEFADENGRTLAMPDLREDQLLRLRFPQPAAA